MLEEHEEDVDDLEVPEQNVDEDEDLTMWSIIHDEDDDNNNNNQKYDYFQCFIIIPVIIIILL